MNYCFLLSCSFCIKYVVERQDTLEDLRVSSYDFTIAHVSKVGSRSYQGEADGEVVWGAGIMIILTFIHAFHFLQPLPSSLYHRGSLEEIHCHRNCFHNTDQSDTLLFLEQELSNFNIPSSHLDPFLKAFKNSDSPHLGRCSGIGVLTSTLAALRHHPGARKGHKKINFRIIPPRDDDCYHSDVF